MHYTNNYLIFQITDRAFRITLRFLAKCYVISERQKQRRSYAPYFIVIHQRCFLSACGLLQGRLQDCVRRLRM